MDWYILMKYKFDTTLTSWWWHTRNKPRNGITSSSPASCQLNFLIFWFSSSPPMGAEVNLLPCTDCSPGLIIPPVTALWLMDIGWSEIANWKIGVGHGDFYEFTLWVKLRDVFKHFIFDHEPFKLKLKIFCVYVNTTHALLCHCVFLFDQCMMKMISQVTAMMMFNAAVTSPLFPAEGKHLLIETEDSESISRNHHSESSEETTPYTGAYVLRLGRSPQTQQSLKSLNLTSST